MRLLIVEDDRELADGLAQSLAQSGFASDVAHSGKDALAAVAACEYQLVILDLGLPDIDGLEILRRIRARGCHWPVLILTARDELKDRVGGLNAGADDYLMKPFALAELEARIRALLRRGAPTPSTLRLARLVFDSTARAASVNNEAIELTARELAVLELLLQRPGRIVSKQQLFESVYSWDAEANLAAVEVFVSRLRRKLQEHDAGVQIRALRGLGYRIETIADDRQAS